MALYLGKLAADGVFHSFQIIVLIVLYFSSPLNTYEMEPSLQIFIPVHAYSQSKILPFTLTGIELQDYPKERISVHISFDLYRSVSNLDYDEQDERLDRNWLTFNQIKEWISYNNASYHNIHLSVNYIRNNEDPLDNSGEYWDEKRIGEMMKLRDMAMNKAKSNWAEYLLFIDSDVILVDPKAFRNLIDAEEPVISPRLISLEESHVDVLHSCVLIDLMLKPAHRIRFYHPEKIAEPYGDWIAFSESAQRNLIPIHIERNQAPGYTMPAVESKFDLVESDQDIIDLELKMTFEQRTGFPLSDQLIDYLMRPREDSLDMDKIYIINLKRDQERRRVMSKRMEIMGIKGQFWTATNGKLLTENFLSNRGMAIIPSSAETQYWGIKSSWQIANFLSHYEIWKDVINQGYQRVIIFEDDVMFMPKFKQRLYQLLEQLKVYEDSSGAYDMIYLGRISLERSKDTPTDIDDLVLPGPSLGAYGYMLTRTGAIKLLESNPLDKIVPVDEYFMAISEQHPLKEWKDMIGQNFQILSVDPCLVKPDNINGDDHFTSITSHGKPIEDPKLYSKYLESLLTPRNIPDDLDFNDQQEIIPIEFDPGRGRTPSLAPSDEQESLGKKLGVDEIYVINLERRPDRRLKMTQRLETIGIEGRFWPAVDGQLLEKNSTFLESINVMPEFIEYHGKPMTFGEIGCFLSHYQVWMDSLENEYDQVLIFEDDATLVEAFEEEWKEKLKAITKLEAIDGPVDLVYLGRQILDHDSEQATQVSGLVKPGFSWWTVAYLIKRSGIEKIIASKPLEKLLPVDDFLSVLYDQYPDENVKSRYLERDLRAISVDPRLIYPEWYTGQEGYISDTVDSEYFESLHHHLDL